MKSETPLVCNMDVFTPTEREEHLQSTTQLYRLVHDIRDHETGFEFVFPNEAKTIKRLAEFISNERLCCSFLEFTLRVAPDEEPILLLISGPEGTKEFLQAEFHEAFDYLKGGENHERIGSP